MTVHKVFRPSAVAANPVQDMTAYELQAAYLDDIFRYVSAFVHPPEEAEDVTMQVLHAAFANLHKLRRADDPRVWVLGIARRKAYDSLRSRYRRREEPLLTARQVVSDSSAGVDQSVMIAQVLAKLPEDQAQALVLKYVNGLTTDEVGQAMGRSSEAANSLVQRARQSFQEHGAAHYSHSTEVPQ